MVRPIRSRRSYGRWRTAAVLLIALGLHTSAARSDPMPPLPTPVPQPPSVDDRPKSLVNDSRPAVLKTAPNWDPSRVTQTSVAEARNGLLTTTSAIPAAEPGTFLVVPPPAVPVPPPPAEVVAAPTPARVPPPPMVPAAPDESNAVDGGLIPVDCKSCQLLPPPHNTPSSPGLFPFASAAAAAAPTDAGCGCSTGNCVPGKQPCSTCEADTYLGRVACALYQCICCPDPCYEPHWIPIADAAFFVEGVRPQSQQEFRWESGRNLIFPDRAEYFWARADGSGRGPTPGGSGAGAIPGVPGVPAVPGVGGTTTTTGAVKGETRVDYNSLSLYTEGATGGLGMFVEMPYLSLNGEQDGHAAGFGDMNIGTKTLLFDCELLQLGFIFRTYIPIGNPTKGLGNGHVSLEPSLVAAVKLAPETYLQAQVCEWIPLGGDPAYSGAILHYHMSLNQVLCRPVQDVPVIGTFEMNGWSFQDGLYTDPVLGPQKASGDTYISLGPGLRVFICDKCDFGIGTAFAVTAGHFADQVYRSEFRLRF